MRLPTSALLTLPETVRLVVEATGESEDCVREALRQAGLAGSVAATGCLHFSAHQNPVKYFAHPALNEREPVPPEHWGLTISWSESRIGRYDLVRLNRADIEQWVATGETERPCEESSQLRAKAASQQSSIRSQPKRARALRLLRAKFPSGLPSKEELPDYELLAQCKDSGFNDISTDTIKRAAKKLRKPHSTG
jgi:hypothetical protein